jgi:hypothetical protein
MNKSIIDDCIAYFKYLGYRAYEDHGSVYVCLDRDVSVQISTAEVMWRADEYLNLSKC